MAKKCVLCGQAMGSSFPLSFEMKDVSICKDCSTVITSLRNGSISSDQAKQYAEKHWQKINEPRIESYIDMLIAKASDPLQYAEQKANEAQERATRKEKMILTTTAAIPGYHIVKTGGLVFGETLFKASVLKGLSSDFQDFGAALSVFSSKEMSGVASMLQEARNFAMSKMVEQALDLGCNAIVGIDCESSTGNNYLMQVSVYGTAVLAEKEE